MNPSNRSASLSESSTAFAIEPSRIHLCGFLLLSLLLCWAILASRLIEWALIFIPLLLFFMVTHARMHWGSARVSLLSPQNDGSWVLGAERDFRLVKSSCVRRYWAILYFKKGRKTLIVAIFPDSLGKDAFRRLRVRARDQY
jgi:hypothetical protein